MMFADGCFFMERHLASPTREVAAEAATVCRIVAAQAAARMAAQAAMMCIQKGAAPAPRSRSPFAHRSLRQRLETAVQLPGQSQSGRRRQAAATAAALAEAEGAEAAESRAVRQRVPPLRRSQTH